MTEEEANQKLRELAAETARAAKGLIDKEVQPIVAAYIAGELNESEAREELRKRAHYLATAPESRLNLILSTQKRRAQSIGQLMAQDPTQLEMYPAWRLTRRAWRMVPRKDWPQRWEAAGSAVGFKGALRYDFVALKSSPIWDALGRGEGGFKDVLGDPFPPFAFGSGMGWVRVSKEECKELGLV